MKIVMDKSMDLAPGDFGDAGDDKSFHVPLQVYGVARELGMRTAESFYDLVVQSPNVVASKLHWSPRDVQKGAKDLKREILKVHPDHFSNEPNPFAKWSNYGARPPGRKVVKD